MPPSDDHPDLARLEFALANAADDLTSDLRPQVDGLADGVWETSLARLTAAAVAHVPGAAYAGMTMRDRDGLLFSRAPSHTAIAELDRVQAETGQGPCVEASAGAEVAVDDLGRASDRWPAFSRIALEAGVVGLVSLPLAPRGAPPGAITFYATGPDAFDLTARAVARAFATHAALVVYGAEHAADMRRAIASRDLIGQAKGILMERFGLDDRKAFELLVRSSQDTNLKLADVARWLTDDVAGRGPNGEPTAPSVPAAEG